MDYRTLASQFGGQVVNEEDKQKDYLELAKQFGGSTAPAPTRNDQGEIDYLSLAKQFGGATEAAPKAEEEKVLGVKDEVKKGESVLAGTTLQSGVATPKVETFKLPGFEHLYPSDESPFNLSEQARTEKLIMQGLDPEFARSTAQRNIAEGRATTGAEYGIARPLTEAEAAGEEARQDYAPGTAGALSRIGGKSKEQYKAAIYGGLTFIGDMAEELGADEFGERLSAGASQGQKQSQAILSGIGKNPDAVLNFLETGVSGAINTALPFLAGPTVGLTTIGTQVFGQEYGEGRAAGLNKVDATARASVMTSAELIGEAVSLPFPILKSFRELARGLPVDEVMPAFARLLVKENLAEQVTTALQFSADKFAPFGIKPDATLSDYLQAVKDTFYQTMAQTLVIGGTGAVVGGAEKLLGPKPKDEEQQKTAAELAKEKGFLFKPKTTIEQDLKGKDIIYPEDTQAAEPIDVIEFKGVGRNPDEVVTPPVKKSELRKPTMENMREDFDSLIDRVKQKFTGVTGKDTTTTATEDPIQAQFEETIDSYKELGLLYKEAVNLAKKDFEEAGYGDRVDTRTVQSGVPVPSEQLATPAGTTTTDGLGVGRDSQAAVLPPSGTKVEPSALGEPPVQPGFTRVYHSGSAGEGDSGRFVSTNKEYASGYRSDLPLFYTDVPANDPRVNNPDYADQGVDQGFTFNFELTPEEATTLTEIPRAPTAVSAKTVVTPIAPVKQGKPRGRPAADLTPEEALAKKQAKAVQTKEWKATNKELLAAKDVLDLPEPTRDIFSNEDAYLDAGMRYRAERIKALDLLNGIATGPRKNTLLGKTAQAGLENPSITQQELAAAKERERVRKGTSRAELIEATDGNENVEYGKFKTGGQALTWLIKNGNEFESTLAKRILPFVRNMKVVIVRSGADLPSNYLRSQFEGAAGMYSNGVIYLDANGGMNNTVFLHEALHGATIDRINKYIDDINDDIEPEAKLAEAVEELNAVMKSAGRMYNALNQLGMTDARTDALARAEAFTDIKEFIAYGMSNPAMQEFLLQAPGMISPSATFYGGLFSPFVRAIRKIFNMGEKHNSAMQDLIIVTNKLLLVKNVTPKIPKEVAALAKKQNNTLDADAEKIRNSKNSTDIISAMESSIKNRSFKPTQRSIEASNESAQDTAVELTLPALLISDIIRWKGGEIPGLNDIDDLTQQMSAMRMRLMAAAAKKAEKLSTFVSKHGQEALGDVMHLARLKKVSPTEHDTAADAIKADPIIKEYERLNADPATDPADISVNKGMITRRTNQINAVYAAWDVLGKQEGGHETYKMVRKYYRESYNYTRELLNQQIQALPIDDAAKAKLLKSVRLAHEVGTGTEAEIITTDEGDSFVAVSFKTLPEDYFPFRRYGKYYLRVQMPSGYEFYLFESKKERNVFRKIRAEELGVSDTEGKVFRQGNDINALRKDFQDSSLILQEMFAQIDQAGDGSEKLFDPANFANSKDPEATAKAAFEAYKEQLKDRLYQTYLMSMPERSFRKQFLHAEKITGFSADILRNFKTSSTAYSSQLAKLKYSIEINNAIQRARDSLTEDIPTDVRGRLEIFVNEVATRAQNNINPPEESGFIEVVNTAAFMLLLTSGATAIVQMTGIPLRVMPRLKAQYGFAKSTAKFLKYSALWNSVGRTYVDPETGDAELASPSVMSSGIAKGNKNLALAFKEASEKYNIFNFNNTAILLGANKTPMTAAESGIGKTKHIMYRLLTALFTGSERMSREISFAMVFELEFEKTGNFDASVRKAIDDTQELLGRYDTMERPRILNNIVGKTAGQYKMYPWAYTSWFVRTAYSAIQSINLGIKGDEKGNQAQIDGAKAMEELTNHLIIGGLFYGFAGTFLFSTICSAIDVVLESIGDEDEARKRRLKNPLTADSSELRFRYEYLPDTFGKIAEMKGLGGNDINLADMLEKGFISTYTDINIGSRMSNNGMWWRDGKPSKTLEEGVLNFIVANAGPGAGQTLQLTGAIDDMFDGKIIRGLEKFSPALSRGPMVATRAEMEGLENRRGDLMLSKDEINNLTKFGLALGFQSSRVARLQDEAFAANKEIIKLNNKRNEVLSRINELAFDKDASKSDIKAAFKAIADFNKRYPIEKDQIEIETIEKSLEAYAKRKDLTIRGQYIPEKYEEYLLPLYRVVKP
jgi:hypothetical protein